MALALMSIGEKRTVQSLRGKDETLRHLQDLGFAPGAEVECVGETPGGMILIVKGDSYRIGQRACVQDHGCLTRTAEGRRNKMQTLKDVAVGKTVSVVKLHGEGAVKRRIMDMGITKGTQVFVRKVAPLGDPVEVTVRGYELSLRKADAQMIEVQ